MHRGRDTTAAENLGIGGGPLSPNVPQTCSRRYSEVMKEYMRRREHRGEDADEHNIKPSEVVIRQADDAGPSGATYVSWGHPETPGMFASCKQPIPVEEDNFVVHEIQEVHGSPRLPLYSPITPESGAESYTTAKTHLSSNIPTQSPQPSSRSRLAQGNVSPHGNSPQMLPVAEDDLQSGRCKAPLINIFSASGSQRFHTFGHPSQDEGDDSDSDLRPTLPMHLLESSGGVDSSCSLGSNKTPCWLPIKPLQSPSRTYVVSEQDVAFVSSSAINEETAVSDLSVMRSEKSPVEENLLHPLTLDFDTESCLDSDPCMCNEEHVEGLSYPPEEVDTNSYELKSKSPQSCEGSEVSLVFPWLLTQRLGGHDAAIQMRRLQRLKACCWVVMLAGFLLLIIAVCLYFTLD